MSRRTAYTTVALLAAVPRLGLLLHVQDGVYAQSEKSLILRALKECNGNRTEAASRLGMSRRTLYRKLHLYQLEGS